jgi:GrpB-like predicted nucleotidyltransferase (UPF0157 family)
MAEPVVISEYDPEWPREFERLRARALDALSDLAVSIEHVGSTAVPGLAAKPVIDLDVVVRSADDIPEAIRCLESLGYGHQGDLGMPGRHAFTFPEGEPRHHLYVVEEGNAAYRAHIRLRDHLRLHPEDARAYAELKRGLAARYGSDWTRYTYAKTEFIDRLLAEPRA